MRLCSLLFSRRLFVLTLSRCFGSPASGKVTRQRNQSKTGVVSPSVSVSVSQYLGLVEVEESRGMHVCEEAVKKLKVVSTECVAAFPPGGVTEKRHFTRKKAFDTKGRGFYSFCCITSCHITLWCSAAVDPEPPLRWSLTVAASCRCRSLRDHSPPSPSVCFTSLFFFCPVFISESEKLETLCPGGFFFFFFSVKANGVQTWHASCCLASALLSLSLHPSHFLHLCSLAPSVFLSVGLCKRRGSLKLCCGFQSHFLQRCDFPSLSLTHTHTHVSSPRLQYF